MRVPLGLSSEGRITGVRWPAANWMGSGALWSGVTEGTNLAAIVGDEELSGDLRVCNASREGMSHIRRVHSPKGG